MRKFMGLFLLYLISPAAAQGWDPPTPCDPSVYNQLLPSVVGIKRMFDPDEIPKAFVPVYGINGTAWMLDRKTLVTIEHIPQSAKIGDQWKEVTLSWGDNKDALADHSLTTSVRLKELIAGVPGLERIALLELEHYLPSAKPATIAGSPLMNNEAVMGIGYREGKVRFAEGRLKFPTPNPNAREETDKKGLPYLPFELWDSDQSRNDRHVFDHGASGSPIANCKGEVVAVTVAIKARTMSTSIANIRISTPWGMANMIAVSTSPLLNR